MILAPTPRERERYAMLLLAQGLHGALTCGVQSDFVVTTECRNRVPVINFVLRLNLVCPDVVRQESSPPVSIGFKSFAAAA